MIPLNHQPPRLGQYLDAVLNSQNVVIAAVKIYRIFRIGGHVTKPGYEVNHATTPTKLLTKKVVFEDMPPPSSFRFPSLISSQI